MIKKLPLFLLLIMVLITAPSVSAKTVKIGVLADFLSEDFQPLIGQLKHEVSAVAGNNVHIEFDSSQLLVNNFDLATAREQYAQLLRDKTDIILAFGPTNSEVISAQKVHRKPTILFGAINSDVIEIDTAKKTSGVRNFNYILAPWSYRKDLNDFQSIYPFKKVAVVGAAVPWDTRQTRSKLAEFFDELSVDHKIIKYHSIEQFIAELEDVDAVYLAEGFGIPPAEIKKIATILIEKKLPSFTSSRVQDVSDGWLATNQTDSNFERLFRRIALTVESVIEQKNLADQPVYLDLADTITLNYNTAEKIDLPIRFSQIATINLVGSFDEVVADRTYTVLEAVEVALEENLSLKTSNLDVALAAENLAAAKTAYRPDLSVSGRGLYLDPDLARLSGGSNPEKTLSGAVTLSQTLYSEDGSANISGQRSLLNAQREIYNTAVLDTIWSTTQASFRLLRQKNTLKSQAENLEITRRNLRVAQQNHDAGQAGKADIFRFRSELASNMQNVIDAVNSFQQAQHSLNAILNNPIDFRVSIDDVQLEGGPFEPEGFGYQELSKTLDDPAEQKIFEQFMIQEGLAASPEVAALAHNLAAVERDAAQYGWRRFIPTVSATAQYNHVFDRSGVGVPDPNLALDSDYNVGIVFSIPLFNQNADNVNLRRAKRQREQLQLQIESQRQLIETRIRDSVLEVSGRIANIELSKVSEQAALQSLKLVEASYASGAATITDLIDSQNNYLQTQLTSSNALYNFIDSVLAVERAVGIFLFIGNPLINAENFGDKYQKYRLQQASKETLK